jgi:hypothetical protein
MSKQFFDARIHGFKNKASSDRRGVGWSGQQTALGGDSKLRLEWGQQTSASHLKIQENMVF